MSPSCIPEFSSARQPKPVQEQVRNLVLQLTSQETDVVESETVEVKGWCASDKELADKVSEAAACLANAKGGTIIIGVADHPKDGTKFSRCPFPNVTPEWLLRRIQDLTMPPVQCSVFDISDVIAAVSSISAEGIAINVPRTRCISGHLTAKGVSKVRSGKECRPQYAAEDDRTRGVVPSATRRDISVSSLHWAVARHLRRFRFSNSEVDDFELLRQAGLMRSTGMNESDVELPLAALLLFGTQEALIRYVPFFETHVITGAGTKTIKLNIVDSVRILCAGQGALVPALVPSIDPQIVTELIVNAYVHRCYRQAGPVIIRFDAGNFEIENPGELPAGLHVGSLIHCVPVYRNLLLAEGARFFALCDKIGQGIDIVYRGVLRSGLPFPEFESEHGRFTARIALEGSAEFGEFLTRRSQALSQLDEIIVLRYLWAHDVVASEQLRNAMQRGKDFGERILAEMARKLLIEKVEPGDEYRLTYVVRRDIENVFRNDQLSMQALWGDA